MLLEVTLLVCVILLVWSVHTEKFDTYSNHLLSIPGDPVDAAITARYTWSTRNKLGDQLYDGFYDSVLDENNRNTSRHIDVSYLDSRFSGISHLANYVPIAEPHPFITMNGEQITLAQGSYKK